MRDGDVETETLFVDGWSGGLRGHMDIWMDGPNVFVWDVPSFPNGHFDSSFPLFAIEFRPTATTAAIRTGDWTVNNLEVEEAPGFSIASKMSGRCQPGHSINL